MKQLNPLLPHTNTLSLQLSQPFPNPTQSSPNSLQPFPNSLQLLPNSFPNSLQPFPNSLQLSPNSLQTFPNSLQPFPISSTNSLQLSPNPSQAQIQFLDTIPPQETFFAYKGYLICLLVGTLLETKTVLIMILFSMILQNEKIPAYLTNNQDIRTQELIFKVSKLIWLGFFNLLSKVNNDKSKS